SEEKETEGEAFETLREAGSERELAVVVAHAAEPGDGGDPGAGQGGDVNAVARVVLEVMEIHERGLSEVVVGELEVPDLRCDYRLRAGRERGVADGQGLVVGEISGLFLIGEGVATPVQREHEVGLLENLLAVEVEVGEVQEQWVLIRPGIGEVPDLVVREALGLRVDAE